MNEKILLLIAHLLIDRNEGSAITGSLMLLNRGLQKRRESHDIDILVNDIDKIWIPGELTQASPIYPDSVKFEIGGIEIDFLLNKVEDIEIVNGIPCGSVNKLLELKHTYSLQGGDSGKKHKEDLEFMNYEFPNQVAVILDDDMPW